jgi:diguanylate cyclase (GGDEF)-like protein/PAS domain S-box-containing protein
MSAPQSPASSGATTTLTPVLEQLLDELAASESAGGGLASFLRGVVIEAGAVAGVVFLASSDGGMRRDALAGVEPEFADRVELPPKLLGDLAEARGPIELGRRSAGALFAPISRRLGCAIAAPIRGRTELVGVLAIAFVEADAAGPVRQGQVSELARWASLILERQKLEQALAASEEKYRVLMRGAADGITLFDPVIDRMVDCNPAAELLFGRGREELLRLIPPEVLGYLRTTSLSHVDPSRPRDGALHRSDGSWQPFEVTSRIVQLHGRMLILSVFRDMTERFESEAALRASEERYALAVEGAHGGLWDWDVKEGVIEFSPRWKSMLGYEVHEIGATPGEWMRRVHPDDVDQMKAALNAHMEGHSPEFEDEHRLRCKDGRWMWVLSRGLAVRDGGGWAVRMAGSIVDITQRKAIEEKLLRAAFHDTLTGLPNRALFMDRLTQVLARGRRIPESRIAVLFLDIDRFKVVNDSLGHAVGDQLLVAIARRLERCIRPTDTVARLGGDEFCVLLQEVGGVRGATRVADRVQRELARPFRLVGHEVFATASIGIALGTEQDEAQTLLRNADLAMYQAKSNGKARHEVFDHVMHSKALELLQLETDLRRALDRQEFRVHLQPLIELKDGTLSGFEALVRWEHPDKGLVSPGEFLPVAEETGLVVPMGSWVLKRSCQLLAEWRERGAPEHLSIAVNLAGRQLEQPDLVDEVASVLRETGIEPGTLTLEITENVVMKRGDRAVETLVELKELGVHLHMDDFGTGLASLAYLRRFPVDTLKIDRSFVSGMTEEVEDEEIVRTIVTLARNLKLGVIAEGIETRGQLELLRQLGCELGQGYLISRPVPEDKAAAMVFEGLPVIAG